MADNPTHSMQKITTTAEEMSIFGKETQTLTEEVNATYDLCQKQELSIEETEVFLQRVSGRLDVSPAYTATLKTLKRNLEINLRLKNKALSRSNK